jgi:hypothetical protein
MYKTVSEILKVFEKYPELDMMPLLFKHAVPEFIPYTQYIGRVLHNEVDNILDCLSKTLPKDKEEIKTKFIVIKNLFEELGCHEHGPSFARINTA